MSTANFSLCGRGDTNTHVPEPSPKALFCLSCFDLHWRKAVLLEMLPYSEPSKAQNRPLKYKKMWMIGEDDLSVPFGNKVLVESVTVS